MVEQIQEKLNSCERRREQEILALAIKDLMFFKNLFPKKMFPLNQVPSFVFNDDNEIKVEQVERYLVESFFPVNEMLLPEECEFMTDFAKRVSHAFNLLESGERYVLMQLLFKKVSQEKLAQKLYVSKSTVSRRKKYALLCYYGVLNWAWQKKKCVLVILF